MRLYDPLLPVSDLVERLRERETAFTDKVVRADDLAVDDRTGNLLVTNGVTREHPFQSQALQLFASKLRVPHSYLVRCPPELRAENCNFWLRQHAGRRLMLRFDFDEVRAVLSPRYQPVSNLQLAEEVRRRAGNVLVRCELDPCRFIAQVVNGRSVEASPGDRLHGGFHVRNSEVGHLAVELRAMIYRTLCTNGLILGAAEGVSFRRRHVTDALEVLAKFGHAAERAVEAGAFLPGRFADTRTIKVGDVHAVYDRITQRYTLDETEDEAVRRAWAAEPEDTLFGIINGLTRAGNDTSLGIDSREKLQETGGRIMALASKGQRWLEQ